VIADQSPPRTGRLRLRLRLRRRLRRGDLTFGTPRPGAGLAAMVALGAVTGVGQSAAVLVVGHVLSARVADAARGPAWPDVDDRRQAVVTNVRRHGSTMDVRRQH